MIHVYVNYPNAAITIHSYASCASIRKHQRQGQRYRAVTKSNAKVFLSAFEQRKLPFAAEPGPKDIWLEINLDTPEQEEAVVHIFQVLIGRRYGPVASAPARVHCE